AASSRPRKSPSSWRATSQSSSECYESGRASTAVVAPAKHRRRLDVPLPDDWDLIPGARGCTPEACSFRDRYADLRALGADVYGLSSQSTEYQREVVDRLRLPFPLLSDEALALAEALALPTFTAGGMRLFKRLTMLIGVGRIERVF